MTAVTVTKQGTNSISIPLMLERNVEQTYIHDNLLFPHTSGHTMHQHVNGVPLAFLYCQNKSHTTNNITVIITDLLLIGKPV